MAEGRNDFNMQAAGEEVKKRPNPEEIRKIAENYYRQGNFYCSEAILKTIMGRCGSEPGHTGLFAQAEASSRSPCDFSSMNWQGDSRVEDGRGAFKDTGSRRFRQLSPYAGASIWTIAPFPIPAHQTVHADFSHTAFRLTSPQGPQRLAHFIGLGKNTPSSPKTLSDEYRRMPRACTLCLLTRNNLTRSYTFRSTAR